MGWIFPQAFSSVLYDDEEQQQQWAIAMSVQYEGRELYSKCDVLLGSDV